MSEQKTYKAKSTSLVVFLLLFFAGMGNKTCKTSPIATRSTPAETSGSVKKHQNRPTSDVTYVPAQTKDSAVISHSDTAVKTSVAARRPASVYAAAKTVRDSSGPSLEKIVALKLQAMPEESELEQLEREMNADLQAFLLTDTTSDSSKIKQRSPAESGKLLDNTGSNYFNAGVQANMSDQIKSVYTTRLLYDSVITTSNKDFGYNTLTVTNNTASKIEVQIVIASPPGWQMITTNLVNITLEPFANSIIPMRFSPTGNNTASWQQVRIEYRLNNVVDTRKTFFKIKVQEYSGFKAMLPNSNQVLTSYQKNNSIPVLIKNSGNTEGRYAVTAVNQLLKLNAAFAIVLMPGKDTTLYIPFTLSESQFALLKKEDIRVAVATEKGETINLIQSLSKVGYILKDHVSAFLDMPLQLEAGAMYQGDGAPIQYYGALYGTLDLSQDDHISMALRSNTIAQGQTNNNSIVRFDYTGKHIQASVGNIQGAGEFMVDGYGARIGYQWKENNRAEVFGMLKSRTGDTKVVGAALQMGLKDNLRIYDALSLSRDNVRQMNSGILSQITEYKFNNGRFALITGIGAEKNDAPLADGAKSTMTGTSLGYNFQWATKHVAAMSNVLYNSNSYPGTFKGQRLQMHDLRWLINNHFVGGYYEYNFRKQNYWEDTLLLTDMFNTKTTNYGLKGGVSIKNLNIILAAGNQRQTQEGEGTVQTNYNYLNLNLSSLLFKKLFVNINSFGGVLSTATGDKHSATVSTTQGNIQYKGFGASFRYDNGPYYYQEFISYIDKPQSYERIIFSPFAEFHLLKRTLNIRAQGNYARTMPADVSSTSLLGNVNYSHPKGYDFTINGIVPVGGSAGNNAYLSAAFRMRIKAPFVAVRKYYNLKLVLFKDLNSNGAKDAGEEPVAGQTLSLNGDLFVSDADGVIIYKNTEKGSYKADFGYSSKLKGWIPNDGTIQYYELSGNRTIAVPYKVSRVLSGELLVEKDSLSNVSFNPNNIKVTATGEKGEVFSTLTNEHGEFYFNVPSGNYIVTLSELAFSDQFRPVQFSQTADLVNNNNKMLYFEIKQKRRQINIRKK